MFALSSSVCFPCRRSLMAASIFPDPARLAVFSRQFTTTPAVLARKGQVQKIRIPSKKAMAAKAKRRAAKEARLVDHSDDMTLESAIAVLRAVEVACPTGCYELFVKTDLRGGGIAVPKGRINIPREPKPRPEDTILVFAEGRQAEEAKRAGAQIVGGTDLIEGILSSRLKANTILCTPSLIRAITPRLGRFLGPIGLMPTERRGTVTDDVAGYIKRIKSSSEWKADRAGNIRMPVARMDFPLEDVVTNFRYVMESIKRVTGNVKLRDQREENTRKVTPIMKVTLSSRNAPSIPISDY
ncbi:ribosomal protein L1-like protein [Mycena maculata]|uniref:Ribosomal protein L1-like protein n=1 Tax=Mycena maculata TaxID=230809 RepID=A0AAD7NCZ0_9AGAR|nr:ribosomal protein L1-like protein [Mycena maculata]